MMYTFSGNRKSMPHGSSCHITPLYTACYAVTTEHNKHISVRFTPLCSLFGNRQQRCWRPSYSRYDGRRTRIRRPPNTTLFTTMAETLRQNHTGKSGWTYWNNVCIYRSQPFSKPSTTEKSDKNGSYNTLLYVNRFLYGKALSLSKKLHIFVR